MIKQLIFTIFLLVSLNAVAQSSKEAEQLFNNKKYKEAAVVYKNLLLRTPSSALYQYRYARCAYELGDDTNAIAYFEKAGERYPLRNFYLGELYFKTYRFEESITTLNKYLSTIDDNDERISYLKERIETATLGVRLLKRVQDIVIVDSLLVDKESFLEHYRLSPEVGLLKQYRQDIENNQVDIITYTNERKDRIYFSDINQGRMNLLTSQKLLAEWSKPQLLPAPINTNKNENYPFVMSDGVTLYFASDAQGGLGGYDIYITRYNVQTDSYLAPENIGMPFNSPANDYMLVLDEIQGLGWFATDRNQDSSKVVVYSFLLDDAKKYIRSEDEIYTANVAQLKTTTRAQRSFMKDKTILPKPPIVTEKKDFVFVINDLLVYTQYDDFKSSEARTLFDTLQKNELKLDVQKIELTEYRKRYSFLSEAEKQNIATQIVALEQQIMELETLQIQLELKIREFEFNVLHSQKK